MKTPTRKIERSADHEANLKARILALQVRDRELTTELVELEKTGSGDLDPVTADLDVAAYAKLMGEPTAHDAPREPVRTVKAVLYERQVVRRAMEIGGKLLQSAQADRQLSALIERMDEWRKLVRQTVIAVLELQRLNRARQEFKRSIGGQPSLPCDVGGTRVLLGTGELVGPEPYTFLQSVLSQGIMTPGEIDRYKEIGNGI